MLRLVVEEKEKKITFFENDHYIGCLDDVELKDAPTETSPNRYLIKASGKTIGFLRATVIRKS